MGTRSGKERGSAARDGATRSATTRTVVVEPRILGPRRRPRAVLWAVVAVALAEGVWLAYPAARARALRLEDTPAARGARLARQLGCFTCHGPEGGGGTKNPGSEEGEVPAFTEQTQMMYVKSTDDLREYVLDGAPRRRREDPDHRAKVEAAALEMPAYRGFVSDRDVDDLVAYLRSASGQILPDEQLAGRGAELALELDCSTCHAALGSGGVPNPGSFKGYVPGFWGDDFDELVRSDQELREWIAEGRIVRIADHPIGRYFFRRQRVKMPAYGRFLSTEDVDALAAYVKWLHAGAWRPLVR
jgi:mono/diheme cytochrome c family protein